MSPRRLVFILVFVLWAVNGTLWAWVQFSPPPPPPPKKVILLVYCDKKDQPKKVMKALENAKIPFQPRQNQSWKREVLEGFKVVNTIKSEETRKSLHLAMKSLLKVKIEGDDIRLGTSYKTKADAVKAQKLAQNKGFSFEIKENIIERTSKVTAIEVGPLEAGQESAAQEALKSLKLKENQIESREVDEAGSTTGDSPSASPSASPT